MSIKFTSLIRFLVALFLIIGGVCASPSTLPASQVKAAGNPVQIFFPLLAKPPVVTSFGAYLDGAEADRGVTLMSDASMSWARFPISWSTVEPSAGQPNWENIVNKENTIKAASANHINIILYPTDTPVWASILRSGSPCGPVAQNKFSDMVHFLTDMVTRYSAPPFNVHYYEMWSEPDVFGLLGCWGDPTDLTYYGGKYYGEMLKVAYPAVKAADPQAQVLFGGLMMSCDPNHVSSCGGDPNLNLRIASFMKGALVDGAGSYFDGVSFHAYDYYWGVGNYSNTNWGSAWYITGPVYLAKAAYLRSLLAQFNLSGKYLVNTEFALLCGTTGLEPHCVTANHTSTVSSYIVQAMARTKAAGVIVNIWFSVGGWRGSQLLDAQLNPLPPYFAYKFARVQLGEATFVKEVTLYAGVQCYEFTQNGRRLWVLWSVTSTGNPHVLNLATAPIAVYDTYGKPVSISKTPTSLSVDLMPVYVEF